MGAAQLISARIRLCAQPHVCPTDFERANVVSFLSAVSFPAIAEKKPNAVGSWQIVGVVSSQLRGGAIGVGLPDWLRLKVASHLAHYRGTSPVIEIVSDWSLE